jgi:hypothetical protein
VSEGGREVMREVEVDDEMNERGRLDIHRVDEEKSGIIEIFFELGEIHVFSPQEVKKLTAGTS